MKALTLLLVLAGFASAQACTTYYNPSTGECACIPSELMEEREGSGWVERVTPCNVIDFAGVSSAGIDSRLASQRLAQLIIGPLVVLLVVLTGGGVIVAKMETSNRGSLLR